MERLEIKYAYVLNAMPLIVNKCNTRLLHKKLITYDERGYLKVIIAHEVVIFVHLFLNIRILMIFHLLLQLFTENAMEVFNLATWSNVERQILEVLEVLMARQMGAL